ncbi:MAG: UDP-N-acetylglucosamine 2-epimerase (non-hydrolyzing) [Candidatus Omnitrophica bacterium]|nr:UDP-N-acetylglucosamine 2-epimerase (non-hydrolyzing) [Candidatus Omnitrophota bacterium]
MKKKKIVHIVGARPQFIKCAAVYRAMKDMPNALSVIIHTGQHFDANMSEVFINALSLPKPDYFLNINSLSHGAMIAAMLERIEKALIRIKPYTVVVYGDTNSTLAGALAAKKLGIRLAHVEAGLRSYNMNMPEEVNRVLTDRISDILFCPTKKAVVNLNNEGYRRRDCSIILSGDVMYDICRYYSVFQKEPSFKVPDKYALVTIHRAENTDSLARLKSIWIALNKIAKEINLILPVHPRTRKVLYEYKIRSNFQVVDPVGYLESIFLISHSKIILTDSGGLQKEAFFFKKPCVILREETEWTELINSGVAELSGVDSERIYYFYAKMSKKKIRFNHSFYGDGYASQKIAKVLIQ